MRWLELWWLHGDHGEVLRMEASLVIAFVLYI